MRIIKKETGEKIHKCRHCKSLIAYEPKDIHIAFDDYIICPVCDKATDISIFDKKVNK